MKRISEQRTLKVIATTASTSGMQRKGEANFELRNELEYTTKW